MVFLRANPLMSPKEIGGPRETCRRSANKELGRVDKPLYEARIIATERNTLVAALCSKEEFKEKMSVSLSNSIVVTLIFY